MLSVIVEELWQGLQVQSHGGVCVCVWGGGGGAKKFGNQFITVKSDPIWTGVELNTFSFWPRGAGPAGKVQICSLPLTLGTGLKLLPMPVVQQSSKHRTGKQHSSTKNR